MKWSVLPTLVIVSSIPVLTPIMAGGCQTEVAKRASPGVPIVIELRPYLGGLRTLSVVVAGDTLEFLFDTGAGVSVIDSAVAPLVRCAPSGRIGGHRSNGGWIEFRECPSVDIEIQGLVLSHDTMAELDFMGFLRGLVPPEIELRPLGGVLELRTFADQFITLDLANDRLILESRDSYRSRIAEMKPLSVRIGTGEGEGLNVFLEGHAGDHSLWLKLDSGNLDRTLLDLHVLPVLGYPASPEAGPPDPESAIRIEREVDMEIAGIGPVKIAAAFSRLTIDGLLGLDFMKKYLFTFALGTGQGWVRPVE
jgi:hypothetical protein